MSFAVEEGKKNWHQRRNVKATQRKEEKKTPISIGWSRCSYSLSPSLFLSSASVVNRDAFDRSLSHFYRCVFIIVSSILSTSLVCFFLPAVFFLFHCSMQHKCNIIQCLCWIKLSKVFFFSCLSFVFCSFHFFFFRFLLFRVFAFRSVHSYRIQNDIVNITFNVFFSLLILVLCFFSSSPFFSFQNVLHCQQFNLYVFVSFRSFLSRFHFNSFAVHNSSSSFSRLVLSRSAFISVSLISFLFRLSQLSTSHQNVNINDTVERIIFNLDTNQCCVCIS